jgi:SanA protein
MKRTKKFAITFILLAISCYITILICDKTIRSNAAGKTFSNVNDIPANKVGILLGTSKFVSNGSVNPYYRNRIIATEELLKSKKIQYLIISGDNGRKEYSEPEMMRADLINDGIDSTIIFLDYAGFRTYDSMKRLKEVFGQDSVTTISQQFHNERALYIAKQENIVAVAYNATDITGRFAKMTQIRERFARVKVFVDYLFGIKPKFLGKKVLIPA